MDRTGREHLRARLDPRQKFSQAASWAWVELSRDTSTLHAVSYVADDPPASVGTVVSGVTKCGFAGELHLAGKWASENTARCMNCCVIMGVPQGLGSPPQDSL